MKIYWQHLRECLQFSQIKVVCVLSSLLNASPGITVLLRIDICVELSESCLSSVKRITGKLYQSLSTMADSTTPVVALSKAKHPPTADMILQAIRELEEPRKGCSVTAIKSWVASRYPEVDPVRFKVSLKKSLTKALDDGTLERPKQSMAATGVMTGSYKIGKVKKEADKKAANKAASAAKKAEKKAELAATRAARSPKKAVNKKVSWYRVNHYTMGQLNLLGQNCFLPI